MEVVSNFLLSGVNVAVNNIATGEVHEGVRGDSSSRLVFEYMVPGEYEVIVYTHGSVTTMDPSAGTAISSFDVLLQLSVRLLRRADQHEGGARAASVPIAILDYTGTD